MGLFRRAVRGSREMVATMTGRNHRQLLRRLDVLDRKVWARVRLIDRDVKALLRRQALQNWELDYPQALTASRFGVWSQNEEDGILLELFRRAGVAGRRFVEIGCGTNGGNSGLLATELGWTGLMVDADPERVRRAQARFGPRVTCACAMVSRENVNQLIRDARLAGEIDLLSIDIDGIDFWIWHAIEACNPRVVVIEYNALFGPTRAVTVPYEADFDRHSGRGPAYYGGSLAAMTRLGQARGYRLVVTESEGVNAFFLRHDVAPEVPAIEPALAYRARYFDVRRQVDVFAHIEKNGLPIIDLDATGLDAVSATLAGETLVEPRE